MARASSQDVIVLGKRRRKRLQRIVAAASSPQYLVLRARIVLAAWRREPNAKIARDLGVCVDTVRRWRARFRRAGIPGLLDRPRSGRPPVYGIDDQLLLVATVTETPPEVDSHWTHRSLAQRLAEPVGISASQIGRILASLDVKPHRVRGWLNRPPDPAFRTKAQAVCRLYLTRPPRTRCCSAWTRRPPCRPVPANAPPARSGPAWSNAGSSSTSATAPSR